MRSILLIALIAIATSLKAQNTGMIDSLDVYKIQNKQLESLLDSAITFEKKCSYYTNSLLFYIHVQKINNWKLVQIGSALYLEVHLPPKIQGAFTYKNHIVGISGKRVFEDLFVKTEKRMDVKSLAGRNSPRGSDDQGLPAEDDRFTFWMYKYKNGQFMFEGLHTYCEE